MEGLAALISTSIIVLLFSTVMMLVSRRDIKNEVSVETNKKIFKVTRIITIICALITIISILAFLPKSSSGNRCDICGKAATHTFQGYGYCEEHYQKAILWAFENTNPN